jgi:tRNA (cmo5U34)-methyltransferase
MTTDAGAEHWEEADSRRFLELGNLLVPGREEQIATLLRLVPADETEAATVVEVCAGGGELAKALLEAFPRLRYVGLDGSEEMLAHLRRVLAPFGERVELRRFELADRGWRAALQAPLRCVLSSLAVHHLSGPEKQRLYADLAARLEPGGGLLIADLVEPESRQARALYARQWDESVRRRSLDQRGDLAGYDFFAAEKWNYFSYGEDDPIDHPSPLREQLRWMSEAGLRSAECFWLRAGHAIFGGYLPD